MKKTPLVSIRCFVYNHEPFLRQCLDGFVMQQTTFPFEAIVHDDASTDGSAAIIREYAERYPDIIKPIYETENQYNKPDNSIYRIIKAAMHPDSKYVAICEGDDYWTDPYKLQLQVDFLESHPDFIMSCHSFSIYYEDIKELKAHQLEVFDRLPSYFFKGKEYCSLSLQEYFYCKWFTQTLTVIYRKQNYLDSSKRKLFSEIYDYIFFYYILKEGKCALFRDNMGVYRKHSGGVYTSRSDIEWGEKLITNYITLYQREGEHRVVAKLNDWYVYILNFYLKHGEFQKAWSLSVRFMRGLSLQNFILCLGRGIKMLFVRKVLNEK